MKYLKTLATTTLAFLLTITASQAIIIQPPSLKIGGESYNVIYNTRTIKGNRCMVLLQNSRGQQGYGILRLGEKTTTGQILISQKKYIVSVSRTATNITEVPIPPGPKPNSPDRDVIMTTNNPSEPQPMYIASNGQVYIDIMILYTPAAEAAVGGESNVIQKAEASVDEANQCYSDSDIHVTLDLVHVGAINYTESPAGITADLNWLSTNSTVNALKQQYKADVVTLFNSTGGSYSGMAYQLVGNNQQAYNVVQAIYAVGDDVLAHEVGHNLGCAHDPANASSPGAYPYSYGYRFTVNGLQWHTVMAYPPGIGIDMFSSPTNYFYGVATGTITNNNVATCNQRAAFISNIEPDPQYTLNLIKNGTGIVTENGTNISSGTLTISRDEKVTLSASGSFLAWTGATNTTNTTITLLLNQSTNEMANFNNGSSQMPPLITEEPVGAEVNSQTPFTLTTAGIGLPTPSYQWYFDGQPYKTGATLSFSSIDKTNQGNYFCVLSNSTGSVTSLVAGVTVDEAPTIAQQPVSEMTSIGGTAMFSVLANATDPLYQWKFNGTDIAGATNRTLTITNAQISNMGNYTVVIANSGNPSLTVTSTAAALVLPNPPVVSTQPHDVAVTLGQSTNLTVTAVGIGPLSYQWELNGIAIPSATSATLAFPNIQSSQEGSYCVQIANSEGRTTSTNVQVVVYNPLTITEQPTNLTANVGDTPIFYMAAQGSAPVTFQWYCNGVALTNQVYSSCRLKNVKTSEAGIYYAKVTNPAGTIDSAQVILTVLNPPSITQQPSATSADINKSASFSVTATGKTPMTYTWYHNGTAIANSDNATLNLTALTAADGGNYNVTITNTDGKTTSQGATLTINQPPSIVSQPGNLNVNVGQTATLSVVAQGAAPMTYTWYHNGTVVGNNDSLQMANVQTNQTGSYYVTISNRLGTTNSQTAILTVNAPATVTSTLSGTNIDQGSNLTITPTVMGQGPISYMWTKNGTKYSTTSSLQINNAQASDAGYYDLTVTGPDGGSSVPPFQITVNLKPTITQQPQPTTVTIGQTAGFQVAATGQAPLAYYWFHGTNYVGTNSATLGILNTTLAEAGDYSVIVSNRLGIAHSTNALLTISDPPVITSAPINQTIDQGQKITFSVAATGRTPMTYTWKKGTAAISGATGTSYTINSASYSDDGTYTVTVANSDGSKSASANLVVITPPTITGQPQNLTVNKNNYATLTVTAVSSVNMTYQWKKNGTAINGATSSSLSIGPAQLSDAGNYTVVVSNQAGSTTSSAATVTVKDPPVFTVQPSGQSVLVGDTLNLSSLATSSETISYQWYFNNNPISGATSANYSATVTKYSGGTYKVKASDTDGTVYSQNAVVSVQKQPPVLTNSLPSSLTYAPGDKVSVTLPLGGLTPMSIQWYGNGKALAGQTGNPLTISSFTTNMVGNYYAYVTNSDGTLTTPSIAFVSSAVPPVITTQPANVTSGVGKSVSFSVACQNPAGLSYQWQKNGANISGATSATLTLNNISSSDVASYSVLLSNQYGTTASSAATLTLINAPSITADPANLLLNPGASGQLSVTAQGYGTLSYAWYKNGAAIAGANAQTYAINNATTNYDGTYYCAVSNAGGTTKSSTASVAIKQPPVITQQPISLYRTPGTTATFSVAAFGRGTLTYQWYKNGNALLNQNSTNLVLSNVQTSDDGNYTVSIYNADGNANSTSASLSVITIPTITSKPQPKVVATGNNTTFSVSATGQGTLTYQWNKNGTTISGASNPTLTLNNVQANTAGTYTVTVYNQVGSVAASTTLTVMTPPTITSQPASQAVTIGGSASLSVTATGSTPITYYWMKLGVPYKVTTSGTLNFTGITSSDITSYNVVVSNEVGTVTSQTVSLTASTAGQPPGILINPQSQAVVKNHSVTLYTVANGDGHLAYQWQFNGSNLAGETGTNLTLTSMNSNNVGLYDVSVSNTNGTTVSTKADLTLAPLPAVLNQPTNVAVHVGATLNIAMVTTNAVNYRWFENGVQYSSTTNVTLTISNTPSWAQGTWTLLATNSYGSVTSAPVNVTVECPPSITQQPVYTSVKIGQSATLSVTAGGTGPFTYQWYLNGTAVSGGNNAQLTISSAQLANEGTYDVTVANAYGQTNSANATLWVQDPPVITQEPQGGTFTQGQNVTITTTVSGRTPMSYTWYGPNGFTTSGTNRLTINNIQTIQAGNYTVMIENQDGAAMSAIATVQVISPPYAPTGTATLKESYGTSFTLSPYLAGTTPMTYQWYKNGKIINGATSMSLPISNMNTNEEGTYSLAVTNAAGGIVDTVAIVSLYYPPAIVSEPSTTLGVPGKPATFSVTAVGKAPMTYQWFKNNVAISGANSTNYTIASVTTNDVGQYYVKISNSDGWLNSKVAYLTMAQAPVVMGGVFNEKVKLGGNTQMFATYYGTQPFTYQWYKNGILLPGQTNQSVIIQNAVVADAGNYSVHVSNSYGSTNSPAGTLSILYPPVITQKPASETVNQGTSAMLQVTADGRQPMTYTWYKNGVLTPYTTSEITLQNVQPNDAGTYQVVISNSDGVASSSGNIWVRPLPVITQQPLTTIVTVSNTLNLTVAVSSQYAVNYQWFKNNTALAGETSASLIRTNATFSDAGTYRVAVTSTVGTVNSQPAIVLVLPIQPMKIPANQIQPVMLQLVPIGNGEMGFTYYGAIGHTYRIEASSDMEHWTPISTNVPTATINSYVDPNSPKYTKRFYRVAVTK